MSDSVAKANRQSLGFGLGVVIGTVLAIQVALDGADIATLSPQDWFYNAGTAAYGFVVFVIDYVIQSLSTY